MLDLPSTYFYDGSGTFVAQESAQIQTSCETGSTSVFIRQLHGPHTGAQCNRTVGETPLGFYFACGSPAAARIGDSHHVHVAQAALEVCLQKAQQILDDLLWIVRKALVGGDQCAGQSVKGWLASGCPAERRALALPHNRSGPAKAQGGTGTPSTSCAGTGIGNAVARTSLTSQIADSPAAQSHWKGEKGGVPVVAPNQRHLLSSMRQHFSRNMPAEMQEAMQNLEAIDHRQVTKELNAHTSTVGASQQSLAELKALRASHQKLWGDYLRATLKTLRQQSKEFATKMGAIQEQEKQCEDRLAKAKASIAQISAGLDRPVEGLAEPDVPATEEYAAVDLEALQKGVEDVIAKFLFQQIKKEDPDTPRPKGSKRPKERAEDATTGTAPSACDVEVCSSSSSQGPN